MKVNRNKTGTFYDIKVRSFANDSDPVLREKLRMQELKGILLEEILEKSMGDRARADRRVLS